MAHPVPETRPRGAAALVLPLPLAAVAGLGAGLAPQPTLVVAAAVGSALVLGARVEWAALAVVGSAVFEDYLDLISTWSTEWLAAVLVVAWLVRRAQGPLHPHRLRAASLPAVLLLAAVALAFAAHPHGSPGLEVSARYALLVVLMLVLADTLCGPLPPARAARVYVLSCVAASVCGLVTAAATDRRQVLGPVENPDTLAFFLVAALPLVGTVRTRPDQSAARVWVCFAVLLAAGIGTQSRPALVAVVAMVLMGAVIGLLALRYAGALLAVVTTGVALVISLLPLPIGQALTDPQRYSDTNIAQRIDVRQAAFRMTQESPVVGLGPGAFALRHDEYRPEDADPSARDLDTAYSTVLEASAELGLLGAVTLYAVWLVPALAARRRWRVERTRLAAGVLLALFGLLTASVLMSQQLSLPLWFVAALAVALGRPRPRRTPLLGLGQDRSTSGQVAARS